MTTVTMNYMTMKYPCIIKNCRFKQRNGRCSLEHITFGYGSGGTNYADCRNFQLKETKR